MVHVIMENMFAKFSHNKTFYDQHGVCTVLSAPNTSEQNGVAGSANKVVIRKARLMLIDFRMPVIHIGHEQSNTHVLTPIDCIVHGQKKPRQLISCMV